MKYLTRFSKMALIGLCLIMFTFYSSAQSVGINESGTAPDQSALLDLDANDKGFLITRADTANINAPAFGLMTLAPIDSCLYLFNGNNWIGMGGGGSDCSCNCSSSGGTPPSTFPCNGTVIPIVDVTNPITGDEWMDRNLGADQVATSSTDAAAYGDLYQWGRCSDGHEKRNSSVSTTLSPSDTPGHGDFIIDGGNYPHDWRSPQNENLWQGNAGVNNPCPTGYRLPTKIEFENEKNSWISPDPTGAYNSPLKLTIAGKRIGSNSVGNLTDVGSSGRYWTSTFNSTHTSKSLVIFSSMVILADENRSSGESVRCIKD